jgi:monoamine oxidase
MSVYEPEVLVLGAGAAGLSAASALLAAGRSVTVLEATSRLGGQAWTRTSSAHPVELGPASVRQPLPGMDAWERRAPTSLWHDGRDVALDEAGHALEEALRTQGPDEPWGDTLARQGRPLPDAVRGLAALVLQGLDPAQASRAGLEQAFAGGRAWREPAFLAAGGLGPAVAALGKLAVDAGAVRLSTVVSEVRWAARSVVVHARTPWGLTLRPFRAGAVVVALPPGVLQTGAPSFTPPLAPAARRELDSRLALPALRVALQLRPAAMAWPLRDGRPLWALGTLWAPSLDFARFETLQPRRAPVVLATAHGDAARRLGPRGEAAWLRAALASLGQATGLDPEALEAELDGAFSLDWGAHAYTRGGHVGLRPGGGTGPLAVQVDETLFFAGAHLADAAQLGTLEGAVASGRDAAARCLAALAG